MNLWSAELPSPIGAEADDPCWIWESYPTAENEQSCRNGPHLGPGPGNANMQTPMLATNRAPCHVLTMPVTNRAPCMCDLAWQTGIIIWITDKYINSNLYHMNTFSYLFQFWLCICLATSVPSSTPTSNKCSLCFHIIKLTRFKWVWCSAFYLYGVSI